MVVRGKRSLFTGVSTKIMGIAQATLVVLSRTMPVGTLLYDALPFRFPCRTSSGASLCVNTLQRF